MRDLKATVQDMGQQLNEIKAHIDKGTPEGPAVATQGVSKASAKPWEHPDRLANSKQERRWLYQTLHTNPVEPTESRQEVVSPTHTPKRQSKMFALVRGCCVVKGGHATQENQERNAVEGKSDLGWGWIDLKSGLEGNGSNGRV